MNLLEHLVDIFDPSNKSLFDFDILGVNLRYQDKVNLALQYSFDVEGLIKEIKDKYGLTLIKTQTGAKIRDHYIEPYLQDALLAEIAESYGFYALPPFRSTVLFEPVFSENVDDYVQDDCRGKIYKLVNAEEAEKIKEYEGMAVSKRGMMKALAKSSSQNPKVLRRLLNKTDAVEDRYDYAQFKTGDFFFAAPDATGLAAALDEIEARKRGDYILEIDISEYPVNCYADSFCNPGPYFIFYVNAFFPIELITIMTTGEFKTLFFK